MQKIENIKHEISKDRKKENGSKRAFGNIQKQYIN